MEDIAAHLNITHSKTRDIPTEVLALIFQFACDSDEIRWLEVPASLARRSVERVSPGSSPIILGSVSALWHETAHSTPQLWTTIHLTFTSSKLRKQIDFITYALDKSQGQPLSISLNLARVGVENAEGTGKPGLVPRVRGSSDDVVDRLFIPNFSRIRELHVVGHVVGWINALSLHSFDRLEFLSIRGSRDLKDNLDLGNCPNLRQLHCNYHLPGIHIAQASVPMLTHVRFLGGVSARSALEILLRCHNLVEFDASSIVWSYKDRQSYGMDYERDLPKKPYALEHLKVFGCDLRSYGGWTNWHQMLAKYLVLPVLEELIWYCSEDIGGQCISGTAQFVERLPPTVRVVHFRGRFEEKSFHPTFVKVLPKELTGLEEITLDPATDRGVYRILAYLSPYLKLKKVTLHGTKSFGFERGSYESDIPELLERRAKPPNPRLVLDIMNPLDGRIIWSRETRERLEGLKLRLKIKVAGKSVSWMDL